MYSQCPDCLARFRVTAEALRAAHGTVRCGRCGSAFDALARLTDEIPPASAAPGLEAAASDVPVVAATPETGIADEYHFSAEDIEKVFVDAREWQQQFGDETATAGSSDGPVLDAEPPLVVDINEQVEDITLEGERIRIETVPGYEIGDLDDTGEVEILRDVTASASPDAAPPGESGDADGSRATGGGDAFDEYDESGIFVEPFDETDAGSAAPATRVPSIVEEAVAVSAARASAPAAPAGPAPPAAPTAPVTPAPPSRREPAAATPHPYTWHGQSAAVDALPEEVLAGARPAARRTLAWTGGSLALALLLLLQLVHHYRQDLARHPQVGPALRSIYGGLGLQLSPNWDLSAFELKQWGNDPPSGTDGRMSVRASLKNRASFAQPHPVLRLELEDRFGDPVAVRDFEPGEYLKNPSQATRMVGPGATSEAEILIVDPGPEAVGYRLDICLRETDRLLRCAQGRG